jgi:hypothetical protein
MHPFWGSGTRNYNLGDCGVARRHSRNGRDLCRIDRTKLDKPTHVSATIWISILCHHGIFRQPANIVFSSGSIISENDSGSFELFDLTLTPYGPDLSHYRILLCDDQLELFLSDDPQDKKKTRKRQISTSSLKRPVVAILDTGLTGCIFSDSLFEDLVDLGIISMSSGASNLQGITVALPTRKSGSKIELSSSDDYYWRFSSFRLPWFDDEERHAHVIA